MDDSQPSSDPPAETPVLAPQEGCRLYAFCVLCNEEPPVLDEAGELVYVANGQLGVLLGSPPGPLEGQEALLLWVEHHAETVTQIWGMHRSVVPLRFGTVFKGSCHEETSSRARDWLELERPRLLRLLERTRDRLEYGVEISYDPKRVALHLTRLHPELARAQTAAAQASGGRAYLLKHSYQALLSRHLEEYASQTYTGLYEKIKGVVVDLCQDRIGSKQEGTILLKMSCLVERSRVADYFGVLEGLEGDSLLEVRLSGPWPPYSFVSS